MNAPSPVARPWSAAVVALLVATASQAAPQRAVAYLERPETDLMLVAVRLDRELLADAVPAYSGKRGVLLPLGELARLLGLAITVDTERGSAAGFFIAPGRRFELDAVARTVSVEGRSHRFDAADVELHQDEVYVRAQLLGTWLPLDLEVDARAAVLTVRPREQLPLQRQRQRHVAIQKTLAAAAAADPGRVATEVPSGLWDGPFVDPSVRLLLVRDPARPQLEFSTRASAELLHLDVSAYLSGTSHGFGEARALVGRKDPGAGLLGPLRATEVGVGEVFYPGMELATAPQAGLGAVVSNFPIDHSIHFDRHAFRGDLAPGWEVELYRNDALLAFRGAQDGGYEFLDVPLQFGVNVFRLVFHGPHGERREEVRTFNVEDRLTPPGQLRYRLIANAPRHTAPRGLLDLELGVARHLSVAASATVLQEDDRLRGFGRAGVRGFWGWLAANADLVADLDGAFAAQAGARTRLGAVGISADHIQLFGGFASERLASAGPLSSRTTGRVDGQLPFPVISALPFQLTARHDRLVDGTWMNVLSNRVSASHRGIAASHELSWTSGTAAESQMRGAVLASYHIAAARLSVRAQLQYELMPHATVTGTAISAEGGLLPGYFFTATVGRTLGTNRYAFGVGKNQGVFALSVNADYSDRGAATVGLTLSLGASRDRRTGRWHLQAQPVTSTGAVSARAFLDLDGDGAYAEGEPLLPGVTFAANRAQQDQGTDASGAAFIPGLPGHRYTDLTLVTSSLEDPFWHPAVDGVRFVPRPGKVALIDFAVQVLGEITGTVYVDREGKSRAAPGVELELVDAEGDVVKRVRTAYDGFYDFTEVPPGKYVVRASAGQLVNSRVEVPAPRHVELDATGSVLESVDLVLRVGGGAKLASKEAR